MACPDCGGPAGSCEPCPAYSYIGGIRCGECRKLIETASRDRKLFDFKNIVQWSDLRCDACRALRDSRPRIVDAQHEVPPAFARMQGERDEARRQVAELTAALAGRDPKPDLGFYCCECHKSFKERLDAAEAPTGASTMQRLEVVLREWAHYARTSTEALAQVRVLEKALEESQSREGGSLKLKQFQQQVIEHEKTIVSLREQLAVRVDVAAYQLPDGAEVLVVQHDHGGPTTLVGRLNVAVPYDPRHESEESARARLKEAISDLCLSWENTKKQRDVARNDLEIVKRQRDNANADLEEMRGFLVTEGEDLGQPPPDGPHAAARRRAVLLRERAKWLTEERDEQKKIAEARLQQLNRQGVAFGEQLAELREENEKLRVLQHGSDKIRERAIVDVCTVVNQYESENCEDLTLAERVERLINKSLMARYNDVVRERYAFQQENAKLAAIIRKHQPGTAWDDKPIVVVLEALLERLESDAEHEKGRQSVNSEAAERLLAILDAEGVPREIGSTGAGDSPIDARVAWLLRQWREASMLGDMSPKEATPQGLRDFIHVLEADLQKAQADRYAETVEREASARGATEPRFCKKCVTRLYDESHAACEVPERVDHPPHYQAHPSGLEAVDLCELLSFNVGNAVKYLWRAGKKGDVVEDLKKAKWYTVRAANMHLPWFGNGRHAELAHVYFNKVREADKGVLGEFVKGLQRQSFEQMFHAVQDAIKKTETK